MSIDQSNFAGGTFGTTSSTYPAVNFDNYKAGTEGVQLIFSPIPEPWRIDIPQEVNACYGIKWAAPNGQLFTSVNFELFNSCNEFPFRGSAYAVSGGVPTLLGSWGNGGVTPTNGGSFNFTTEQNVTEIRVYALDARLGTTGNNQPYPNVYRAWNGQTLGINSIQVATALVPAMQCAAISPMVKLRRDQSAVTETNGVAGTHMISMAAARGEGQSAQVLVSALRNFSNGSVSYTPLTGPGGATITPEWRLADYVHVTRPTWVSYKVAGYYPDPLVALKPFSLQAGDSQSVWMDVWVPRTAAPGTYTGTVTISGGGMETTLPVSLTVKNVLLPVTARLDTLVQFLYSRQRLTPAAYNALCEMGLKYRFTSAPNLQWDAVFSKDAQGAWQADWTALDAEVERFLPLGITQFKIECVPWALKAPTGAEAEEWNAKLSLTSQHLRAKGWMDKFLLYIFDEPTTVEVINDLNGLCDFIHAIDPDFRILYTNGANLWGLNADVYVTHSHLWENQGVVAMEQKRQAGCEVWAYTCMGTQNIGSPDTWKIDWRGTGARALGWWLWMRQADGYLYWALDAWSQDPYNITDPIPGVNGDGFMFYPDSQNNPSIPSLRLSLMRDALQDYDLLAMLKDKIGTDAALMAQYGSLLTTTNAFSYSGQYSEVMEYQDNPAMYEQRHTDLLNALDALSRELGANSAVPGTAYSSSIAGSSSNAYAAPLTYERLSGPAWLNIASDGTLTGTPQAGDGGVNVWTVRVKDEFGGSTIARLSIQVLDYSVQIGTSPIPNAAPYFLSDPIAKAGVTAGSPMSGSLAADAGDWEGDPLTYSKTSGPAWLTVASNGAVSGTPPTSAQGANNFVVSVADGSGGTDTATLQINVVAAPFELWKQENFTPAQLAQPGVAGELDDPDRDGTPNLLEYALGMNQNVASSSGLPVGGIHGGYLTLSFNRQKAATDITYQVEAVGNMNSSWVEIWNSFNLPYGGGENPSDLVTVQDTVPVSDAPKRFMRLKVTK
jgi:hypothetical protein